MARPSRSAVFGPSATSRGPDGMRPCTTVNDGRADLGLHRHARHALAARLAPGRSAMTPTSSTPSTALQRRRHPPRRRSGAQGPVPAAAGRIVDQGVEAGAEGDAPRRRPPRRTPRRRSPTGPGPTCDPRPGRGPSRHRAGSTGAKRPLASSDAAGRRARRRRPGQRRSGSRAALRTARVAAEQRRRAAARRRRARAASTSTPGDGSAARAWPIGISSEPADREERPRAPRRPRRPGAPTGPPPPCTRPRLSPMARERGEVVGGLRHARGAGPGRRRRARPGRPPPRRRTTRPPAPACRRRPCRPGTSSC